MDITDTAFDVVLRGYDKRQVDERLRFLSSQLTAAESALRVATQRAAALQDDLTEARAASVGGPPGDSHFGARVEKILTLAEDEAREIRRQADAAAAAVVEQAQTEADQIRKAVAHEADELFKATRADTDQVCRVARAEAERLVAAATDTAAQRERSSAHDLRQLSRLQQEINADLYRVKEALDSLFGATGAAIRASAVPAPELMAGVVTGTPAEATPPKPTLPKRRIDGAQPTR